MMRIAKLERKNWIRIWIRRKFTAYSFTYLKSNFELEFKLKFKLLWNSEFYLKYEKDRKFEQLVKFEFEMKVYLI